jgi:hypothetical protein
MGEVYMKITSDNQNDFYKNQRFLKKNFILIYFLEAVGFILVSFLTINYPEINSTVDNLDLAIIVCLIVDLGLLALLVGYHFFKYYIFFIRMKSSSVKGKKKCTWQRGGFIFWHIFMITMVLFDIALISIEFVLYCLKDDNYREMLIAISELRKALMYLLMHLYSFTILLLYYYIALN